MVAYLTPSLWIVNTLDPAHPGFWEYYDIPVGTGNLKLAGKIVYVSSGGSLYSLRINDHVMQPQAYMPLTSRS